MKDLEVAVWQSQPERGAVQQNLRRLQQTLEEVACRKADLLVAPEMALTGWHPEATKLAVRPDGPLVGRVGDLARTHGTWIACSVLTERDGLYYNTFMLWDAQGRVAGARDKIHLWGAESRTITPGQPPTPIETPFGRVGGLVCYDVEFPEVARSLALAGAEIFLVPSAFYSPTGWELSTRTRALENGCFVAAANQVGGDEANPHNGMSRIVDPFGHVAAEVPGRAEGVVAARMEAASIKAAREYAPFLRDLRMRPASEATNAGPALRPTP